MDDWPSSTRIQLPRERCADAYRVFRSLLGVRSSVAPQVFYLDVLNDKRGVDNIFFPILTAHVSILADLCTKNQKSAIFSVSSFGYINTIQYLKSFIQISQMSSIRKVNTGWIRCALRDSKLFEYIKVH